MLGARGYRYRVIRLLNASLEVPMHDAILEVSDMLAIQDDMSTVWCLLCPLVEFTSQCLSSVSVSKFSVSNQRFADNLYGSCDALGATV